MPNSFAISMTRPHETLGLAQPFGRRLPQGIVAWNALLLALTLVCGLLYVVQVNMATTKGYALRKTEKRIEALKTDTMMLQDKIATMSSIQSLHARATDLGFVAVDTLDFVNPAAASYALAR